MSDSNELELKDMISEIITLTLEGKILWSKINPTTFVWVKKVDDNDIAKVTLQKVTKTVNPLTIGVGRHTKIVVNYIFQVIDIKSNMQMINISTNEKAEYKELLLKLFDIASQGVSSMGLNFLRKLLKD